MVLCTLAFLAGLCTLFVLPALPGAAACLGLGALGVSCLAVARLRRLAAFPAGVLYACAHAAVVLSDALPPALTQGEAIVQGEVIGLPEQRADGTLRFRFRIDRWRAPDASRWFGDRKQVLLRWYREPMRPGARERWQLRVKLKPRRGFANPGGFDFERWLFAQRLAGTGYVRGSADHRRLAPGNKLHPDRWRQRIVRYLDGQRLGTAGGLVKALAVGDRSGVPAQDWQVLRATGTSHLLAISGLHIGFVAGLAWLVFRRVWAATPGFTVAPASVAGAWAAVAAAAAYAVLAGLTLPTQRALLMVAVFMSARMLARRGSVPRTYMLALWVVLLCDPLAVLSEGFWLSFGAVACILWVTGARHGAVGRMVQAVKIQLALAIGLLPLLLAGFAQVPLLAPLANAVAVPLVGLLAVPLILAALAVAPISPTASSCLLQAAAFVLERLLGGLGWLAGLPYSQWLYAAHAPWQLLVVAAGTLLLLAPRGLSLRGCGLALCAAAWLHRPPTPAQGDVWAELLDVGQGLSMVVRTRSHTLVYDAGPRFPSGLDTGAAVVVPYLLQKGIRRIDALIVSHDDIDHIGGARALFETLDVRRIRSGTPQAIDWARAGRCLTGQGWRWDGVDFEILAPRKPAHGNNASCVLKVTGARGHSLLLTGDIEAPVERRLIAQAGQRLHTDVLVAPHHGSRTSSTAGFIAHVDPRHVLFPAGYANRFGFPKADVVERYRDQGARLWSSGDEGAIAVCLNAMDVGAFRARTPRIWRSVPAD
jgi:competence protein ComEC